MAEATAARTDADVAATDIPVINLLGVVLGAEGYGVRRGWLSLFSAMRRRGMAVSAMVLYDGPIGSQIEALGLPVDYAGMPPPPPMVGGGLRKLKLLLERAAIQLKAVSKLRRCVGRTGANTILLRSPAEVLLAGLAARLSGVKAYWLMPNAVSSGYPLDMNRRVYRFIFNHLNVVPIANSRFTDTTIGPGSFERHVCHLGIDPAEFDPLTPGAVRREDIGIPAEAIVLGVFARMIEGKGQRRLAEAVAELGDQASRIHLLLCGGPVDSQYALKLKDFLRDRGLADRVHFTGPITDVVSYYKLCDVVVNSRLDPEPFGFSVIEGMMLAKPVLAHKAGGPGETVVDGKTGWHIGGPEKAEFVLALRRMLADVPRFGEIGAAARAHALGNFTNDQMASRIIKIIAGGGSA